MILVIDEECFYIYGIWQGKYIFVSSYFPSSSSLSVPHLISPVQTRLCSCQEWLNRVFIIRLCSCSFLPLLVHLHSYYQHTYSRKQRWYNHRRRFWCCCDVTVCRAFHYFNQQNCALKKCAWERKLQYVIYIRKSNKWKREASPKNHIGTGRVWWIGGYIINC